jgi:tRNA U34 5-carboxymethylaminomethyl modifying enzyme MnmG/GidA
VLQERTDRCEYRLESLGDENKQRIAKLDADIGALQLRVGEVSQSTALKAELDSLSHELVKTQEGNANLHALVKTALLKCEDISLVRMARQDLNRIKEFGASDSDSMLRVLVDLAALAETATLCGYCSKIEIQTGNDA